MIKPKFNVGDTVIRDDYNSDTLVTIESIDDKYYYCGKTEDGSPKIIPIDKQGTFKLYNSGKNIISVCNKILSFLILFLYIIGLIGGIGYTLYNHAWVIAIGVVVLGVMGWPMAKECFEKLTH